MDRLVAACIQHRFLVIFMVLLVGTLGVRAAQSLPIDAVPDVTNVQVQVLTDAPTLGPVEVEELITVPVEAALSGLPKVEELRSLSRFGLSAVTVVFEEGTDIYFARQLVSERLGEVRSALPGEVETPELGPVTTGLGEIVQFELRADKPCPRDAPSSGDCTSLMELRSLLDSYLSLQLRPLPGVVEVNAYGGELKTYEVQVDPDRLHALQLTLQEVFDALQANNRSAGGGYLIEGGEQRVIRGEGRLKDLEDIRWVRVATRADGQPLFIQDVATVQLAPMLRQGAVTRDGRGEVVTGTVMMLMGSNSREVSERVTERLEELREGLPPGVSLEIWYDRSELVDRSIRTVTINLIEGGVLVVVVLLLMLGNLRGGLVVASVIPLSLLATFIVMGGLGISGNLMSLGALDFGLIIDGAIVVIENISRRLSEARARGEGSSGLIRRATQEVTRPVLFGTGIIMIVYVPVLSLQGIEGKMFRPMAAVVLSALAAALILAFTFVPVAASWLYREGAEEREGRLYAWLRERYEPALAGVMREPRRVLMAASAALFLGTGVAFSLGGEFLPRLDEGAIAMQAIRLPSVSLEESVASTTRIERVLLEHFPDEIDTMVSRTGRAEIATDPMGVELSDIFLMLHPKEEWTKAADKEALVEAIQDRLREHVAGQNFSFSQPIELRTNELISGVRSDLALHLHGPDLSVLQSTGEELQELLASIDGASDLTLDLIQGMPTLRVVVDRPAAARYGINAAEILDAVSTVGGQQVGLIFEGQQRYALQVRLQESYRSQPESLQRLLIAAPDGQRVPLGQLAELIFEDGPAVVNRQSGQRRLTLQVNVRGRDLASYVREAQAQLRDRELIPEGYFVSWGGQYENLRAASSRLAIAVPAALALILLLLYTALGSLRPALIIYLNIPIAAVGGVFALALRGMPFSISAAVGFIALSGIAVLNGLVLITTIRRLQSEGLSRAAASEQGARLRLRAVLMTALTDGLGFLPMALSTSAGAEVQRPLATVVLGGLISATMLTLFVLPVIYQWLGDESDPEPAEPEPAPLEPALSA